MPAAAFIKYFNNKNALFIAVLIFILPFILFSFWNFPSADDYMIIDKRSQFSFWALQSAVYHNWTGRYFATFISSIFSYSGFLYSHYYVHSILLLLLTVLSWVFCLRQINRHLLFNQLSLSVIALVSMLLLIVEINVIPEPVTAFYWFSSAVTYQLPLMLIILLTGLIIKISFTDSKKNIYSIIAGLLIILLNGCNEMITLFVLVNATCLLAYYLFVYKKIPKFFISLFSINFLSASFLLFSPGISNRGSLLGQGSFISAISIAFIKFIVLNWYFLKEPLWWFIAFFTASFFYNNRPLFEQLFIKIKKLSLTPLLLFYTAGGLLIYIPVLYVTNGSLPLRAENSICFLYSLILLFIITICILVKINGDSFSIFYKYKYVLFSILIFSTGNMKKVTDSMLSGYFYHLVMKERLNIVKNAYAKNDHEIAFDDYATAINKKIKDHPAMNRQLLKEIILKPPPIICFGSDLYDMNYLKEFYGIKKINIIKE